MNRRQKIIVSVTGIFLVLLLLIGLTYAYFLTIITGNTNDKSISVSTANLAIVYGGDNGLVIGEGEKITPGTTFEPKTFTVTNQGNANTDYVVVIEEANVTYAETIEVDGVTQTAGTETTFESNDFTYTLTCESGCNSVQEPTAFPIEGGILVGNRLAVGETQTYSFTLTYNETGENQSNDMNKKLEAKINIIDITKDNPYKDNTNSLAYNIINNAMLGTTGTTLVGTPETVPAVSISGYKGTGEYELATDFLGWEGISYGRTQEEADLGENTIIEETDVEKCNSVIEKYISNKNLNIQFGRVIDCDENGIPYIEGKDYENVLSVAQDDYGASYYYRGAVEDNYLNFNNMCWRIVRIEGDGSIKLILEDKDNTCETADGNWDIGTGHYGYNQSKILNSNGEETSNSKGIADYINSITNPETSMRVNLESWLLNSGIDTSKLKEDDWCLGGVSNLYNESGKELTNSKVDLIFNDGIFYYNIYKRLLGLGITPYSSLNCDVKKNEKHKSYIGTLTADEVAFAGGIYEIANINYYLINNYQINEEKWWWTLSIAAFEVSCDQAFSVGYNGILDYGRVRYSKDYLRPSIVLATNTLINGGNGTKANPYKVN